MRRTRLGELTIKHNFMFGAVMIEPENCKGFLERALQIEIDHVEVSLEKSIVYHQEYKGVRLDVYAKDEKNTRYNVEMQVLRRAALGKRSRYYQSQMDMEILLVGSEYENLPDSYVIFVCDFDPFGKKKHVYTFQTRCKESEDTELEDGRNILFLSTHGENESEVSKELVSFLKFVKADLQGSEEDFHDVYVKKLQEFIHRVKENRKMEERFMVFEEMLRDERKEGKKDALHQIVMKMFLQGFDDEKIMEICEISREELESYKQER